MLYYVAEKSHCESTEGFRDAFDFYRGKLTTFLTFPDRTSATMASKENRRRLPEDLRDALDQWCSNHYERYGKSPDFLHGLFFDRADARYALEQYCAKNGLPEDDFDVFRFGIPPFVEDTTIRSVEPAKHCNNCRFRMFEGFYERLPLGCLFHPEESFASGETQVCDRWAGRLEKP